MEVPLSLKPLQPYLTHAKQTGKFDKLIAYYCRCYAVQLGIEINKENPHPDNKNALLTILDKLDSEKKELGNIIDQEDKKAPYVKEFAMKIFNKANEDDLAGKATRETARAFYASSIFFTMMKQFTKDGVLEDEIEEKLKYSKWKAADINTAFKEGRKPTPGPATTNEEDEFKIDIPSPPQNIPDVQQQPVQNNQQQPQQQFQQQQQQFQQPQQFQQQPQQQPQMQYTGGIPPRPMIRPTQENYNESPSERALRHAKYAVSSLQFDDVGAAINNIRLALHNLGVNVNI